MKHRLSIAILLLTFIFETKVTKEPIELFIIVRNMYAIFLVMLALFVTSIVLLYKAMPGQWKLIHESGFPIPDLYALANVPNIRQTLYSFYITSLILLVSLYLVPAVILRALI